MDQNRAAEVAQRLIRQNGRQVDLVRAPTAPADPSAPWDGPTPGSEQRLTVWAVVTDYKNNAVDGEEIMRGDRMLIIPALEMNGEDPNTYESVVDGSDRWNTMRVETIKPGSVPIVYKMQARL